MKCHYPKILAWIAGFLLIAGFTTSHVVFAQSNEIKIAKDKVDLSFKTLQLATLPNNVRTAKYSLLTNVFDLLSLETQALEKQLTETAVNPEFTSLQLAMDDKLTTYLQYLVAQKKLLTVNLSLADIETIGGNFTNWREKEYNPHIQKVIDLVSVFTGDAVLKKADARFTNIFESFKQFKGGKEQTTLLRGLLSQAALNLKTARQLQYQAENKLSEYLPKNDTVTTETTNGDSPAPDQNQINQIEPTIQDLFAATMTAVKSCYQNFISMYDALD